MYVRLRQFGKADAIIHVDSKLTKIKKFRRIVQEKVGVKVAQQRLLYGGKLLEDDYTFHDYNIKLNDVIQLMIVTKPEKAIPVKEQTEDTEEPKDTPKTYKESKSILYAKGDKVDVRDEYLGSWVEGEIVQTVADPNYSKPSSELVTSGHANLENIPDNEQKSKSKPKSLIDHFKSVSPGKSKVKDEGVLFKIHVEGDDENEFHYRALKDIRPRSRNVLKVEDVKIGQKILVNHNMDNKGEKGHWYDFKVTEKIQHRKKYEFQGTIYIGQEGIPQHDTTVKIMDKIFSIEDDVVPIDKRSEEYNVMMKTPTEKRSEPLNCMKCRDDESKTCKECGCYTCASKVNPDKIILCDECDKGFHLDCLDPPLKELPTDDWYCPSCKLEPNEVVAPGAAKQAKKENKTQKDWGRGMACVGKTKTCSMPSNHFGPIPGIEVGMMWKFRIQLSEVGVHRPPVSGIHGRDTEGAYSIVLSGGYEDDYDDGNEFSYTGSGGRDLSGNKRTAEQSSDQKLTRENRALARNCAAQVNDKGGDAGDKWRDGRPVRVSRSWKMQKHFPEFAPEEGLRYDGIYKVVKYYQEKGKSGFMVWKYLLRRDDSNPAPWEEGAKKFSIIYPDGYLEAEADKKSAKEGKEKGKGKKRKGSADKSLQESPNVAKKMKAQDKDVEEESSKKHLNEDVLTLIKADENNSNIWKECLDLCKKYGYQRFIDYLNEQFLCVVCQELVAKAVTTPCSHNFCKSCLERSFKTTNTHACPMCRHDLRLFDKEYNESLNKALQAILPGYDSGRK